MKLLTYKAASELLEVPIGTLYAWVHEKKIPHIRLGPRTVRFDLEELQTWLAERRRSAR